MRTGLVPVYSCTGFAIGKIPILSDEDFRLRAGLFKCVSERPAFHRDHLLAQDTNIRVLPSRHLQRSHVRSRINDIFSRAVIVKKVAHALRVLTIGGDYKNLGPITRLHR